MDNGLENEKTRKLSKNGKKNEANGFIKYMKKIYIKIEQVLKLLKERIKYN